MADITLAGRMLARLYLAELTEDEPFNNAGLEPSAPSDDVIIDMFGCPSEGRMYWYDRINDADAFVRTLQARPAEFPKFRLFLRKIGSQGVW
jgi:hypothetical protein